MATFGQEVAEAYFGADYMNNPVKWASEKLGVHLWSKQREIITSLINNRYTACPSCHDGGKSFDAAVATVWWIDTHEIGSAFVISTAPSSSQVSAILWREIEKLHRKAKLVGRITGGVVPEWKIGKETVAYGRKPADYNVDTGFQGVHALYPLIIIDEATGIPSDLWDAVDALATNDNARVLAIGNPDDSSSHFKEVCDPGSGWNVIHLDGMYTPNMTETEVKEVSNAEGCGDLYSFMTDNGIPFATEDIPQELKPSLLSARWVAERMKRWGVVKTQTGWETSALWDSKVRGQFPEESDEGIIPLAWVDAAIARWKEFHEAEGDVEEIPYSRVLSCDVARFGDDNTVVAERKGHYVFGPELEAYARQDTMTTAKRLAAKLDAGASTVVVDVVGLGAGVVDRLREMKHSVFGFNAGHKTEAKDATGEFEFANTRTAAWWRVREKLDPNNSRETIMLPPDEKMRADLIAPRWREQSGGRIMVEPKTDTKKRLGRSPDHGDAVVMAFWRNVDAIGEGFTMDYGGESDFTLPWEEAVRDDFTRHF